MANASYQPGDPYYAQFTVKSATGALVNADAAPTVTVSHNATPDAAVTTNIYNQGTGIYFLIMTIPSTYPVGDYVSVLIHATVGGVATGEVIDNFRLVGYPNTALPNAAAGAAGGLLINGSNAGPLMVNNGVTFSNAAGTGLICQGGGTGIGIQAIGGSTSGHGIQAYGQAGNSFGILANGFGTGAGIAAVGGATGHGIEGVGGGTSGNGIYAHTQAGNGCGIVAAGVGSGVGISAQGGPTGHGIGAAGGSSSGDGLNCTTTGGVPIRGNITGNITGNLSGSVGSVTGNVAGNVSGSVGSVVGLNPAYLDVAVSSRSTYAGTDTAGTTTLLGRLTAARAANLDNLDAAVSSRSTYAGGPVASVTGSVGSVAGLNVSYLDAAVSSRSTYAGADTPGTATLVGLLTPARAANLDHLDVAVSTRSTYAGGAVASVTAPVTAGTVLDKSGYALAVTPPTAAQIAAAILANPAHPIATDATGNVALSLAQPVPTSNGAQTIGDCLNGARAQGFGAWAVVGNQLELFGPDGVTPVRTFTLDNPTGPTRRT